MIKVIETFTFPNGDEKSETFEGPNSGGDLIRSFPAIKYCVGADGLIRVRNKHSYTSVDDFPTYLHNKSRWI